MEHSAVYRLIHDECFTAEYISVRSPAVRAVGRVENPPRSFVL